MGLTNRKITKTIYITPEQGKALDNLSRITKVPQSEYIRQGIDLVIKHYERTVEATGPLIAAGE